MRREPEFFDQTELDLVYMARTLRDALQLEKLLAEAGIEYMVETGVYTAGLLIKRDLTGAFFYVAPKEIEQARRILLENRYEPYATH